MSHLPKISERIYQEKEVITFQKNKDDYGCFSNMYTKIPFRLDGILIHTTEHLYQALKFTNPDIQKQILSIKNPIDSKRKAYEFPPLGFSIRSDWESIKVDVMKFCIRCKLFYNSDFIGKKLIDSYQQSNLISFIAIRPLVEKSSHDNFWGAIPNNLGQLKGKNVLGRLWMQLREQYYNDRDIVKQHPCEWQSKICETFIMSGLFVNCAVSEVQCLTTL